MAKGKYVKNLRRLSEREWTRANDAIPKMCKVYLRHLMAQSFHYKAKRELVAHDFNYGISIDWNDPIIASMTAQLMPLGFASDDVIEAIFVSNKCIDAAINYLLMNKAQRIKTYQQQKLKQNRFKMRKLNESDYRMYRGLDETNIYLMQSWKQLSEKALFGEIESSKKKILELKAKR